VRSAAPDVGTRDLASVRPDDLQVPIARHQFPLGVVAGSLALVLYTGTRLQRVAAVLAMQWSWFGLDAGVASYYSVRLWLLVHRELELLPLGVSELGKASCRESRGIVPRRFSALVPIPKGGRSGGRGSEAANRPPFGLGPWVGARVAPLRCPILRPGRYWL